MDAALRKGLPALVGATVLALTPVLTVAPAAAADHVVETVLSVPGTPEDGAPVSLDATLLTTDPGVPRPAIVLAHGLGGTKADSLPTARRLARDGYAVLVYTARGFGASGGLIHLDDPAYEGRDAVAMVDAAAARPEVERVGTDPVIGFAGASYGGAVALEAAALDPRIDAIVPAFTYTDLTSALVPQHHVAGQVRLHVREERPATVGREVRRRPHHDVPRRDDRDDDEQHDKRNGAPGAVRHDLSLGRGLGNTVSQAPAL